MAEHLGPIRITISDPESGEVLETKLLHNDYVIICAGNSAVDDTIKDKANVSEIN